ncbi:hypothetical protein GCM10020254_54880 [Streptomyces goshikiensis]
MTWWKKTSEKGTYMPIPTALIPAPRSRERSPATLVSRALALDSLVAGIRFSPEQVAWK